MEGSWKYLKRLNTFFKNKDFSNNKIIPNEALSKEALNLKKEIHSLIKLTTENFDTFRFNSAVANIRKLSNLILENDKKTSEYNDINNVIQEGLRNFLIMISPITPHLAEELWSIMGQKEIICLEPWPSYDEFLIEEETIVLPIQINGKLKNTIKISNNEINQKDFILGKIKQIPNIKSILINTKPKKIIFIPGKVINIVI